MPAEPGRSSTRSRVLVLTGCALFVFLVAQLVQQLVVSHLALGQEVAASSPLSLEYIRNQGAAFGLFPQFQLLFLVVAILVSLYVLIVGSRYRSSRIIQVLLGMLVGGALSNASDRIRYGYVVDYIYIHVWPVFNLADAAITVSAVGIAALLFFSDGAIVGKDAAQAAGTGQKDGQSQDG